MYAAGGGVIQNTYSCVQGNGMSRITCTYVYFPLCFWQHACLMLSSIICSNFSPTRSVRVAMEQPFSTLNYFCKSKLAKMLLNFENRILGLPYIVV